jgi:hypothetical protein
MQLEFSEACSRAAATSGAHQLFAGGMPYRSPDMINGAVDASVQPIHRGAERCQRWCAVGTWLPAEAVPRC